VRVLSNELGSAERAQRLSSCSGVRTTGFQAGGCVGIAECAMHAGALLKPRANVPRCRLQSSVLGPSAWVPQGERTDGAAPVAGQQEAQAVAPTEAPEVGLSEAAADPRVDTEITLEQFKEQLRRIDKTLRALPATAQARPRRPCSGLQPCDLLEAAAACSARPGRAATQSASSPAHCASAAHAARWRSSVVTRRSNVPERQHPGRADCMTPPRRMHAAWRWSHLHVDDAALEVRSRAVVDRLNGVRAHARCTHGRCCARRSPRSRATTWQACSP